MNKQYRVKKNKEIELIIKEKKFWSNPYYSVYKRFNPETKNFRYAISVGKKLGNAVVRNQIKRKITAILDNLNINLDTNTDVFIIARSKLIEADFEEMKKQLKYLFKKLNLLKGEKNE